MSDNESEAHSIFLNMLDDDELKQDLLQEVQNPGATFGNYINGLRAEMAVKAIKFTLDYLEAQQVKIVCNTCQHEPDNCSCSPDDRD